MCKSKTPSHDELVLNILYIKTLKIQINYHDMHKRGLHNKLELMSLAYLCLAQQMLCPKLFLKPLLLILLATKIQKCSIHFLINNQLHAFQE